MKRQVEIETLLRWAYQDELPKLQTSAAEGIWDRLAQNGSLGGIDPDPGHGAAQRYAHFGLPHPDAETIEKAVSTLPDASIDWAGESEIILGDLLALVDPRPFKHRATPPARHTRIGYNDRHMLKKGLGWARDDVRPPARRVIMVRTLRTAALVTTHAAAGSRPEYCAEGPRCTYIEAERGPRNRPKIVGECRAKNLYSTGSYCPLQWDPSPISIVEDRADYLAWWRGLKRLAASLDLGAHDVLPPAALEFPWLEPPQQHRVFYIGKPTRTPLPLKLQRERAGPPRRQHSVTKIKEGAESA